MFKASTSFVVNKTLPQLAFMDGLAIPNLLNFEVTMVPTPMMEKALWYVEHQDTHIKRKYGEGEYTSKKWVNFDEAREDIKGIHLAGTPEMKTLITRVVGVSWDSWGTQMNVFWDSNCVAPWDC